MIIGLLLHPKTEQALRGHLAGNLHGLLLTGPRGSGKVSLARQIAAERHGLSQTDFTNVAQVLVIGTGKTDTISIETIRTIEHFLALRVANDQPRTIVIEDAHGLSIEAQNALLKILEEPPANTMFILTSESVQALLPTIQSRITTLPIGQPESSVVRQHFRAQGFDEMAIERASLISGGLPGLMHTLLTAEADHPLLQAAALAGECVQKNSFERLCLVDSLAKNRQLSLDTLWMLQQMAHVSLTAGKTNRIWPAIMQAAYEAEQQLLQNAQPKLVLTNLMLHLTV